jgi:hypothetical protein
MSVEDIARHVITCLCNSRSQGSKCVSMTWRVMSIRPYKERPGGLGAQVLHLGGADGQVGDKVAVHDIHVQPVRALVDHPRHLTRHPAGSLTTSTRSEVRRARMTYL